MFYQFWKLEETEPRFCGGISMIEGYRLTKIDSIRRYVLPVCISKNKNQDPLFPETVRVLLIGTGVNINEDIHNNKLDSGGKLRCPIF